VSIGRTQGKTWDVMPLLRAVYAERNARVTDPDMWLTDEQRAESCRVCGHDRRQHPGGYPDHPGETCLSTVPSAVGTYWREPCPCREWVDPG
jgi:hypothetical protein